MQDSPIVIVTDSTACLPPGATGSSAVRVVNLHVHGNGHEFTENVDFTAQDCEAFLRAGMPLRTSQPAESQFTAAYAAALRDGAEHIISLHISAHLSGTCQRAAVAARAWPGRIHVIDSTVAGLSLGFLVMEAQRLADQGMSAARIADTIAKWRSHAGAEFLVDTLDRLVAGGRLSAPMGALGQRLGIRPMLSLKGGTISPHGAVRSAVAGTERLIVAAQRAQERGANQFAVQHCVAPDQADDLAQELRDVLGVDVVVAPLSTVLAAHTGIGTLAVVWARTTISAG